MLLDARFRHVFNGLPLQLRYDKPQSFAILHATSQRYIVIQRVFMGITLNNRLLRLHRAYMSRGYDDEDYAYSTETCLEAAYQVLDLVRQSKTILCKWWVTIVHVWTSGLVITVDMFRGKQDKHLQDKRKRGLELAIWLLE